MKGDLGAILQSIALGLVGGIFALYIVVAVMG